MFGGVRNCRFGEGWFTTGGLGGRPFLVARISLITDHLRRTRPLGAQECAPSHSQGAHIFGWIPEMSLMTQNQNLSERKTPHHAPHPREECDIIFVTVCTNRRIPILANHRFHRILLDLWRDNRHWMVGRYVLMPDHLHLFAVRACNGTASLDRWIPWWKRKFSLEARLGPDIWQQDFWDTRMRSAEHYNGKWLYVRDNPIRKGFVRSHQEWRYQGEIYVLKA